MGGPCLGFLMRLPPTKALAGAGRSISGTVPSHDWPVSVGCCKGDSVHRHTDISIGLSEHPRDMVLTSPGQVTQKWKQEGSHTAFLWTRLSHFRDIPPVTQVRPVQWWGGPHRGMTITGSGSLGAIAVDLLSSNWTPLLLCTWNSLPSSKRSFIHFV